MFWKTVVVLLILATLKVTETKAKRELYFQEALAECKSQSPEMISSYECHLVKRNDRFYGSGHIMFHRRINTLGLQLVIERYVSTIGFINVINIKFDLCYMFGTNSKQRYIELIFNSIKNHTNEVPHCPLKQHFNYTLSEVVMDAEIFPTFLPTGNYSMFMNFFDSKEKAGYFKLQSYVVYKEKKNKPNGVKKG